MHTLPEEKASCFLFVLLTHVWKCCCGFVMTFVAWVIDTLRKRHGFMTRHSERAPAVNLTPLWIVFDIAETFCWYEHLVMMFRHVSRIMQMAVYLFFDTTPHYRCYIVTVVFSIPMPRTQIVWAVVKMFLIHICKSTCPFIEIFLPRGFTMQLPGGIFLIHFNNKTIYL